jgi:3-phosphoshikimate 1-carboxyvinyltransferase
MIKGGNVKLVGEIKVPGDKSISHRAIMIGSLAKGKTIIRNFLMGEDCLSTIRCFRELGVEIDIYDEKVVVNGVGLNGLKKPHKKLDVGNSGTTIRLMSGILAAQKFPSVIEGDESIMKRPMDRIIAPLRLMGADIKGIDDKYPPLIIRPVESLSGICYRQPIASAQVKSSILLAGLYSKDNTSVIQPSLSRDHTERMLKYFGIDIKTEGKKVILNKGKIFYGKDVFVPGDISSAAFFIVGALILKDSKITVKDVGLNKTRTGIIDALKNMGGNIGISDYRALNNEPIGDITVEYSKLKGITIEGDIIPRLIDEIPIIAVAASLAQGTTIIRNAEELKVKESNRLRAIVNELRKMNVDIEELEDGMIIRGPNKIKSAELNSYNDHRITMALSILSLCAEGQSVIDDTSSVNISFPNFYKILESLKS